MLTIFTEDQGVISAAAHGARRLHSKTGAAAQFLCFAEFTMFRTSSEICNIFSITPIESFFPIQEDIGKLALSTYCADVLYRMLDGGNPDVLLLRLFLNTMYALAYKKLWCEQIKTVFEWRAMSIGGYMPQMDVCGQCGAAERPTHFRIASGSVICEQCSAHGDAPIDDMMLSVIRYAISADDKKLFSFRAPVKTVRAVSALSEQYVSYHLDSSFGSLRYYRNMGG